MGGLVLLSVLVVAVLRYVLTAGDRAAAISLVQGILAVLIPAASLAVWLWARESVRQVSDSSLDGVADVLAEQIWAQWAAEAAERRLLQPAPIAVRWRWSDLPVTGPLVDAVGDDSGWQRFAPLPGLLPATATALSHGVLRDLFSIYGGLGSGRLVILGAAGSGKTGSTILLLLDALAHRRTLTDGERAAVPVPVMFTLHGWDPARRSLAKWLEHRLYRDYPFLKDTKFGPSFAGRLISSGLISVILDGLDDMPEALRPVALRAINEQANFRLILLARSREMVAVAANEHLSGAAALELLPIGSEDAADYLTRSQVQPLAGSWQRLVDHIRSDSGSAVAQALSTPLMLTLVRDTYRPEGGGRVDELLETNRFCDRTTVEDHLLDRILPVAYAAKPGYAQPRYELSEAQRWLGLIAQQMNRNATRDLAWWLIPHWQPALLRIIITWLAFAPGAGLTFGFMTWFTFGLLSWFLHGFFIFELGTLLIGGLMAGNLWWLMFVMTGGDVGRGGKSPHQIGRPTWKVVLQLLLGVFAGALINWLIGVFVGRTVGFGPGASRIILLLLLSALGIPLLGFVKVLASGLARPASGTDSPIDPITCWRRDRRYGLVVGTTGGLVVGLVLWLGAHFQVGLDLGDRWNFLSAGLVVIVFGLVFGIMGFMYSQTWPTMLSFIQLRCSGQGPCRMLRFLEDARQLHVLRTVGPVYQFRHARLQDRLARQFEKP
jgi:hypothetical protein